MSTTENQNTPPAGKKKLTPKQEAFVREYLIDLNATQAAIRAGYSKDTAYAIGHGNLKKAEIAEAIEKAAAERAERVKIDADWVLKQAVELHLRCMQEIKPVLNNEGEQVYDEEGNALYKFDSKGAAQALTLVGKHIRVNAFQDVVKHTGLDALAERLERAAKRT